MMPRSACAADAGAVWICDADYVLPAYASLATFAAQSALPMYLYVSDDVPPICVEAFQRISDRLTIRRFEPAIPPAASKLSRTLYRSQIRNRLTRFAALTDLSNDHRVVFHFDSDTVFEDDGVSALMATVNDRLEGVDARQPVLCGVPECERGSASWYYFQVRQPGGGHLNSFTPVRYACFEQVFGARWYELLAGSQINNGVMACHAAHDVCERWRDLYTRGLACERINPEDDQVPLVAAAAEAGARVSFLNFRFNSRGVMDGHAAVYHAWAGFWRPEIARILHGIAPATRFGQLTRRALGGLPDDVLQAAADAGLRAAPHAYTACAGIFEDEALYRAVAARYPSGRVVELWRDGERSTCFMAELIKYGHTGLKFDSLDDEHLHRASETRRVLDAFRLREHVDIVGARDAHPEAYADGSVNGILACGPPASGGVVELMRRWWRKLAPDGVLAVREQTYPVGMETVLEHPLARLVSALGGCVSQSGALFISYKPS